MFRVDLVVRLASDVRVVEQPDRADFVTDKYDWLAEHLLDLHYFVTGSVLVVDALHLLLCA